MDPIWLGILALIALFVLLALGIYVGLALAVVGFVGILAIYGSFTTAIGILTTTPFAVVSVFALTVVPLFVLMGLLALHCGMGEAVYTAAFKWVGRIPGGLGIATMMGNTGFGAVSGSSVVAATVFTKLSVPQMRKYGYDVKFACGITASGGIIAMLIPPSIYAVLAGIITEQPIGMLLLAGIGPGLLIATIFSLGIFGMVKARPNLAPIEPEPYTWGERFNSLKSTWAVLLLALTVVGGIYLGVFSPTEAGATGALGAFLIAFFTRRLTRRALKDALMETVRVVCMVKLIIIGANIFSRFLAVSGVTQGFIAAVIGSDVPPLVMMLMFMFMYLVLGMFLDGISMMFLTLPVIFPIVLAMGYNPIWFLMAMIVAIELGLLTPPLGLNVYAVKAAAGDQISMEGIFQGVLPFFILGVIALAILFIFPSIITFLPNTMLKPS
ncbi:MAG: TRAP transporter large permease [Dehalococcoidia bacterium]|nr:TRAP transporter large permease [Dehalococcoidia bacterium]